MGGGSYCHDDNGNAALFAIPIGNGEGDAFTLFVNPDDDKLPCPGFPGDTGGINLEKMNFGRQVLF